MNNLNKRVIVFMVFGFLTLPILIGIPLLIYGIILFSQKNEI
ncbi:hypothetical protein [Spiroplasma kunkelii]|nr:hypothetical protein [Spiroplasma kunkelii]